MLFEFLDAILPSGNGVHITQWHAQPIPKHASPHAGLCGIQVVEQGSLTCFAPDRLQDFQASQAGGVNLKEISAFDHTQALDMPQGGFLCLIEIFNDSARRDQEVIVLFCNAKAFQRVCAKVFE